MDVQNQLTQNSTRAPLGRVLLNLAIIDCLLGVGGYVYLNVLHAGEVLVGETPLGSAAMTLMWMSWWLSVAGLALAVLAALLPSRSSMLRSRDLWLSIAVNSVYVLPLALLLATRHLQLGDRV